MFQEIIAGVVGLLVGTITGISPSIHINLVSALVISWLPRFANISPISGAIFVVSLAVTHTTMDFLPSIYLGAPNDETALTVLPSHQLLKEGRGHEAALLALRGSLSGAIIAILLSPLIILFSSSLIRTSSKLVPFILIFIVSYVLLRENKIISALLVFILSGFLGFFSLNLGVKEPLLPLLSGLFGASGLIISLKEKTVIVEQKTLESENTPKPSKKDLLSYSFIGAVFSMLPALGSGYASIVSSEIRGRDDKKFIYSVGLMNMLIMISSFSFAYATKKARTGASAAVLDLIGNQNIIELILLLSVCICSAFIAFLIGKKLSEKSAKYITKINYRLISFIALFIIFLVTAIFSNILGILILITGTAIGVFTIESKIKRTTMMGCLIIPTLIFYLSV